MGTPFPWEAELVTKWRVYQDTEDVYGHEGVHILTLNDADKHLNYVVVDQVFVEVDHTQRDKTGLTYE